MAETIRRILRMKQVVAKVGLSKSTLYEKIKNGEFPAPFSIGGGRARGFLESAVDEWLDACVKAPPKPPSTTIKRKQPSPAKTKPVEA